MDIRLHDELSVSGRAESAREALEMPIPQMKKAYEQLVYLSSLHDALATILAGDLAQNPYFSTGTRGIQALRGKRASLTKLALDHDEVIGSAEDAGRVAGWNRLMLVWLVNCQITLCLERLGAEDARATSDETNHFLARNELLTTPGGILDVSRMSLNELRRAIDVFRDKLFVIDQVGSPLYSYLMALEQRAAQFVCGIVPGTTGDYDYEKWVDRARPGCVSKHCIASLAWYFTWLRRHIWDCSETQRPSFFTSSACTLLTLPDACTENATFFQRRNAIYAFVLRVAQTMDTDDHRREFSIAAAGYNVSPGDLDAHSHVYGMSGVERATVRDVVAVRQCAAATSYAARDKWKQKMADFIASGQKRAELNGVARKVGNEALIHYFIVYTMKLTPSPFPHSRRGGKAPSARGFGGAQLLQGCVGAAGRVAYVKQLFPGQIAGSMDKMVRHYAPGRRTTVSASRPASGAQRASLYLSALGAVGMLRSQSAAAADGAYH